jgi:hypothetical protein
MKKALMLDCLSTDKLDEMRGLSDLLPRRRSRHIVGGPFGATRAIRIFELEANNDGQPVLVIVIQGTLHIV